MVRRQGTDVKAGRFIKSSKIKQYPNTRQIRAGKRSKTPANINIRGNNNDRSQNKESRKAITRMINQITRLRNTDRVSNASH